jgi:hypothetical protein
LVRFTVMPVTKPILSVSSLTEAGFFVHFGSPGELSYLCRADGHGPSVSLFNHAGLYFLPAYVEPESDDL